MFLCSRYLSETIDGIRFINLQVDSWTSSRCWWTIRPKGGDKIIPAKSGRNSLSETDVARDDPLIAADLSRPPLKHTHVLSEQEDSETSVNEYEHDYDYENEHNDEQLH